MDRGGAGADGGGTNQDSQHTPAGRLQFCTCWDRSLNAIVRKLKEDLFDDEGLTPLSFPRRPKRLSVQR